MSEWLGHHDLCSIQWSDVCDCDPHNPIDFSKCTSPASNHGDGRGCGDENCPRRGGERDEDICRPVDVDGEVIRVHGAAEMTDEDRGHFAEIVRAVKRRYEAEHPPESTGDNQ